jgi:hypothetical protein
MGTPLYRPITSSRPPLRVGVMLDRWNVPSWVAEVLSSVPGCGVAEITTVILNAREASVRPGWLRSGNLLWRLYVRLDRFLRPFFAGPFKLHDVRSALAAARVISIVPQRDGGVSRFGAEDVARIKAEELDVILRFGFNIVRGGILKAAKYGIWSYHHGDNHRYRGGPAGFWEMYERNPLTGTILQILTEELDGGKVIYRTHGATQSFESLLVNRYWQYRKAIPFVARCLRRLYEHGEDGIRPEAEGPEYKRPIYRTPTNAQMVRFLARAAYQMIIGRMAEWLRFQRGHWFLGVAKGVQPGEKMSGRVRALHPPSGRFWADPMITCRNGHAYVFFEDYEYRTRRGRISVIELDGDGRAGPARTALETDHHLSYPFVFEWRGNHYMIPETASVRAVQLYRAIEFPTQWEYVQDLLTDVRAVDATLCEHEDRWYLFTSVSEAGGSSWDELFLFVSESPLGPWSPHPMNPIVSDVRRARPGGPLFKRDGVLYRPGQNSERTYGHSLAVLEVTELSPERYAERFAFGINPDWMPGIHGCHTIAMARDLVALDCKTTRWRP